MKNFYTANGRAKLMIFKSSASDKLPGKKALKVDFGAQNVTFYKSWGHHSLLIRELLEYPAIARGEELSSQDREDLNNGVYASFDMSASPNIFSMLKYSEIVLLYADITYEDYQTARRLRGAIADLLREKDTLGRFCRSMKVLAQIVTENDLEDDVQGFDSQDFMARYGSFGSRSISMMRHQLGAQCEKFRWVSDSSQLIGGNKASINDEDQFRDAA